ncbi:Crp/Fnr family transcriptional regulator [Saccharopolyspora sp. NFXS83]|uniref:Crp/Fnr family transcriptional regulator n=1 Tax=Saccharopolyspora sp. NFXS83 TaxID=2993560 RepID=UPI00224B7B63|nr:Crp/Fnr family transcriptional regulator [Saccharopolyspora sp. NFXS83]MCX2729481.1 Crp/Fnr family transcriptional regulator [Saccharopolyspora sp. NFXS83]
MVLSVLAHRASINSYNGLVSDGKQSRRLRGFRALTPEPVWAALVQHGVRKHHHTGERLLGQGEPGGWLLVCLSGRLKVVYTEPDGREVLLAVRGPGDLVGEFSGRDGQSRSATVQAIEPGITSKLADHRFSELVQRFSVTEQLTAYIMGKMRESASHAWRLAHHSAAARLVELIETLLNVAGPDHPHPNIIAMSQEELASALGLARSAITPVLATWKSAGLIRTARGKLQVLDFAAIKMQVLSSTGQNQQ